jgi:hypothetical protein
VPKRYTFIYMQNFREFEAGPDPFGRTWRVEFRSRILTWTFDPGQACDLRGFRRRIKTCECGVELAELVTDAYLCAFANAARLTLVAFDKKITTREDVSCLILGENY